MLELQPDYCVHSPKLLGFIDNLLDANNREFIEDHLKNCSYCSLYEEKISNKFEIFKELVPKKDIPTENSSILHNELNKTLNKLF